MNFVPVIRLSRKVWQWVTIPLALVLTLPLFALALFPLLFVYVLAFLRGKRINLNKDHE